MPTESNTCFDLVISGIERWVSGGVTGGCSLCSEDISGLWLDVEEETTASND